MIFRSELRALSRLPPVTQPERAEEDTDGVARAELLPVPGWVTAVHVLFIAWTVANSHYPALFLGGFLFFLGFARATAAYQSRVELRAPLLVGFFLGGLVIHGGLQSWWIAPVLASLSEHKLYLGATILTAFNDNALITYLATLVPNLDDRLKLAVVEGAVTGGGLTVIANAPNPAGQALLAQFFDGAVLPIGLAAGALLPTLIAIAAFRLLSSHERLHVSKPCARASSCHVSASGDVLSRRNTIFTMLKAVSLALASSLTVAQAAPSQTQTQAPAPTSSQAAGPRPEDPIQTLVGRLDLERYKATIKGLTQFGDRRQGTDRNRAAVDWIEAQLEELRLPDRAHQVPSTSRLRGALRPAGSAADVAPAAGAARVRATSGRGRAGARFSAPRGAPASTTIRTCSPTRSCAH